MSNLSWRAKLMGLSILVLGASLLFQLFYVRPTIRNQQVEMAQAHQEEMANNIAWELENDLVGLKNTLVEIAARAEFRSMHIANQQQTVTQVAEFSPGIHSLYVMDAEGWFVAGTAEDLSVYQKKSYTDKPYYIAAVEQGQVYFAAPRSYFDNTLVSTSVSVPIESDTGERVGLLVGTVWLNPLIEKLKNYPLDEETTVFLVDREGTVVAHSGIDLFALEEGPLSLDFSDEEEVRAIMVGEIAGSEVYGPEGEPHFSTWTTLESNGWGVVVEAPMSVILARSESLAGRLLSVNAVLFVIALAVSLVFTGQITAERQRAEEEIKTQKEFTDNVIDSLPDTYYIFDPESGKGIQWNKTLEEISGYSYKEMSEYPPLHFYPPEEHQLIEEVVKTTLEKGRGTVELNYIIADGTRIPFEYATVLIKDAEGKPCICAIGRDITERKRMEEQLVRQEKLAVLGQLSGGVGHELRNPLGVISNAIYYLQATLPDADETTKEYLEMISSEVRNSEKIVSDLLDLSRTKPAEREEVAVSELVAEVLEKQPPPEDVEVTTEIASDLPSVFVDPRQIGQALTNLVTNAYQAMPEGGGLTIEAKGKKDQVHLSITDTGCGIPQENMGRLFEPLFTTRARGIGLGLAVSKNLVEVNGGSIEVESEVGKGSTFTVILPTEEVQS